MTRDTSNSVDLGLQMLQDRRRMLGQPDDITARDRQRIAEQSERVTVPWTEMQALLVDRPDLITILDDLWPNVLPYLIKGNEISPVHHIAYVVRFIAQIGLAQLTPVELKRGIVAALLHDIGIGDCALPKISEARIQRTSGEEKERLRKDGIESRLEHMKKGVEISRTLLNTYRQQHPASFSDDDLEVILDIVGSHDYSKIPLMEDVVDRKWLLTPDRSDWLKQCHWEADAMWMLSPAGILVDLEREQEENTSANRQAKFQFNLGLHRQIITLYSQACSAEEMQRFGFHDGLLYRSQTGYDMAMNFQRIAQLSLQMGNN